MEDGFRYALDTVASAFLPESEFGRDGAEPPKEPWQMLRKHFESNYMQHSVLRPEANPGEVEQGIRQNGFSQGIGPNVVRPTSGNPTDIMQRNYGTKAGVPVIAVPSMHTQQGGNGARIKDGWKLEGGHIGVPERDYEPLHRIVVRTALAAGKPVPPEVLAEHPDLVNTKATKPPAQEFARKPAKGQKGFDFDEGSHPRESSPHDGKRPGEFAPKDSKALAVGSESGPSATLNLKPNMVYGDARDQAGRSIGFVTHPHDGTPDGMRASHANLKSQMNEYDPEDWSNIQTRWGATDESGQPAFVISPNGKHIATAKSPAARYILGDVHSDSKDGLVVNSPEEPEVWHQGDRVRMTGKTEKHAGGTFHEAEILEGHKKGQKTLIRDKDEKDAEIVGKQQERKDQQEGFAKLNSQSASKASTSGATPEPGESHSDRFLNAMQDGRIDDAVGVLSKLTHKEAEKIAGDLGLPVYNMKTKKELLATVRKIAENNTPEKRATRAKQEAIDSANREARTAIENADSHRLGRMGAPLGQGLSDEQIHEPHADEHRHSVQDAWSKKVASAVSKLDTTDPTAKSLIQKAKRLGIYDADKKTAKDDIVSKYPSLSGYVDKSAKSGDSVSEWSPENHLKIAADGIDKLRAQDIHRLLDSAPPARMQQMANYIRNHRPEFSSDIHDAQLEIDSERTPKREFSRNSGDCRAALIAAIHTALNYDGKYAKDDSVDHIPENASDLDPHMAEVITSLSNDSPEVKAAMEAYLAD